MTKQDVFSLALKILGVYTIIVAISTLRFSLSMIFSYITNPQYFPSLVSIVAGSLLPLLLLLILSYYLIKRSDKLSKTIFPDSKSEKVILTLSSVEIQSIAFSIIGVLVIVWALPKLFEIVTQLSYSKIHRGDVFSVRIGQKLIEYSVDVVIRLALGLYLFIGSKGLSTIWHKIHTLK